MPRIVAVHSHHGGTGKSRLAAAAAGLLAAGGHRVGLVDTALQSPALDRIFGLDRTGAASLAGYLAGRCEVDEICYDVSAAVGGPLTLVPASLDPGGTADLLLGGYDVGVLADVCLRIARDHELDLLLLDTHPGLSSEASLGFALADAVALVVRPDGPGLGENLGTGPDRLLVLNMVPPGTDPAWVARRLPAGAAPVALVPYSRELAQLDGVAPPVPAPAADSDLDRELRRLAAALAG
jgi:MinD-like ATPase involved in chromosome partitioning or flagellar assembly